VPGIFFGQDVLAGSGEGRGHRAGRAVEGGRGERGRAGLYGDGVRVGEFAETFVAMLAAYPLSPRPPKGRATIWETMRASLTLVIPTRRRRAMASPRWRLKTELRGRLVQIGVFGHDGRVLAAEFQQHGRQRARALGGDGLS
jgi:hypothetical protein